MRDFDHLVVIEGYFEVFRPHAVGVGTVALMGSSIAEGQIALLRRLEALRTITLLLDGDAAGRKPGSRSCCGSRPSGACMRQSYQRALSPTPFRRRSFANSLSGRHEPAVPLPALAWAGVLVQSNGRLFEAL